MRNEPLNGLGAQAPAVSTAWASLASDVQSLAEVNATIAVPRAGPWFRKLFAFAGPGYLVSVGYMDPGNWATDLAGGSRFGYSLWTDTLYGPPPDILQ